MCDLYLGFQEDFDYNPTIKVQKHKHLNLNNIISNFNNPKIIFCYTHRINDLSNKIHLFNNVFVLITHNSDGEIRDTLEVNKILNFDKLYLWFSQNICINHSNLRFLPIGFANSMWPHGNISIFKNSQFIENTIKSKKIYFNFNINTSLNKRQKCFDSLKNKLINLPNLPPRDNLMRLSEYEFSICPEGNGVDTHRLWESIYLKTVPIVIESEFTTILFKNNIPLVVLKSWDDLDINSLNYNDYNFEDEIFKKNIDLTKIINLF